MKLQKHKPKPACFSSRLVFMLLLFLNTNSSMAATGTPYQDTTEQIMTVAKVYQEKYSEPETIQVTFYESARFYKIVKSNPHSAAYISLLKESIKKQKPVCIRLATPGGDIIEKVSRVKKG
jgi:hypothetical protein